jgi:hypothetical protein
MIPRVADKAAGWTTARDDRARFGVRGIASGRRSGAGEQGAHDAAAVHFLLFVPVNALRERAAALYRSDRLSDRDGCAARRENDSVCTSIAGVGLRIVGPGITPGEDFMHGIIADAGRIVAGGVSSHVAAMAEWRL